MDSSYNTKYSELLNWTPPYDEQVMCNARAYCELPPNSTRLHAFPKENI